jgi:CelD/BcsL family acetyltransferase involved in cellulose biosynthesis
MADWKVTRLDGGLGSHIEGWDHLNRRLFGGNALLTGCFVDSLLKHFSRGDEHLCILRDDKEIEGMCILHPKRRGVWATFQPSQAQIGPTLLQGASRLRDLVKALPGYVLQLNMLCNDPAFGDLTTEDCGSLRAVDHALTIAVRLSGTFEQYWQARSKQLRKNAKRWERHLDDDAIPMQVRIAERPAAVARAVDRYSDLESRGWKGRIGTALHVGSRQHAFYADLLERFSRRNDAYVFELYLGDVLAASRLVIKDAGMLVILKTTYDETLQQYAPGRMLLREVIREAFRRWPGHTLEFYTNANADQLSWASEQRPIRHVTCFRNAFVARTVMRARAALSKTASNFDPNEYVVECYQDPNALPIDVQRLFEQSEQLDFDLGVDWYSNFVRTVAQRELGVRFYVLRHDKRPIVALPVNVRRSRMPFHNRVESLTNYYTALYAPAMDPSATARQFAVLLRRISRDHSPVASMAFEPMDPRYPAFELLLEGLRLAGFLPTASFCFGNWYLPIDKLWGNYFLERPGQVRNTVKRMERKLGADGGHVEIIQDRGHLDVGIDAYLKVYAASWKREEPFPDFVPGLMNMCVDRGWLRLGIAWLHARPIAAQLWIVAGRKAAIYKLAHDDAYKAYSPGTVLTAKLMQHVLDHDKVAEVDYLIGDDAYKRNWMTHRRERWRVVAHNSHTIGGIAGKSRDVLAWYLNRLLPNRRTRKVSDANTAPSK